MSGILKRAEGRPRPWTWVEVANDQIVTNFRNFFYVFACPSCGAESGATAEIIREMMAGDRQGRCPQCYEGGAVANFWEVQMPIADLTIAGPLPEGSPVFRVRLYEFPPHTTYNFYRHPTFQAVVTSGEDFRHVTFADAREHGALPGAFGVITEKLAGILDPS